MGSTKEQGYMALPVITNKKYKENGRMKYYNLTLIENGWLLKYTQIDEKGYQIGTKERFFGNVEDTLKFIAVSEGTPIGDFDYTGLRNLKKE